MCDERGSTFGESDHLHAAGPAPRRRQVPHTVGNWATLVYIDLYVSDALERASASAMTRLHDMDPTSVWTANTTATGELTGEQPAAVPVHVSLSRTVYLQFHHITLFVSMLTAAFSEEFAPFTGDFDGWEVLANDDRSRLFVCLMVDAGHQVLCDMIAACDRVVTQFRQPAFYRPPKPHASVAWRVTTDEEQALSADVFTERWHIGEATQLARPVDFDVVEIKCKIGNKLFRIPLKGKQKNTQRK